MNTKNGSIRLFFLFLFSIFLVPEIYSQVTCSASAPPRVEVGQTFEYKVTLNEKPSGIVSTNFSNFKVVGGPLQGAFSSTTNINGQRTETNSYVYTYYLQAEKKGSLVIPSTVFKVNGQQVKSNNVTVNVVDASPGGQQKQGQSSSTSSAPTLDENDVFIRASVSKTNVYEGEQVIVTYKLYVGNTFNGGFRKSNLNIPSQSGLWSYELSDPNNEPAPTSENLNGKSYRVYEIRKMALFPQKTGEIVINPLELDFLGRVIYQAQRSRSPWEQFLGGGQRSQDYRLHLKSNSIKLQVKPLPTANRPADFSGLVGSFNLKSNLTRTELKANEATDLTITISGSGNIQHIQAPQINFPADFDVTEPKITDQINTSGSGVTGSRTFEYVIIPRTQGEFTIPAGFFSFYDSRTNSYKTLSTDEYRLKVSKGDAQAVSATTFSNRKDIQILDQDIRYIKISDSSFKPLKSPFFASSWYILLLLCPLLLFVIFLVIWRKQLDARRNIVQTKDRRANKVARKRLKKAHRLLQEGNTEAFYNEISQVLWGYMSDKFHIPLAQLSTETVEAKLREKDLDEGSIKEFLSTLHQCEFARFAPGDPEKLKNEMYTRTLNFITKIEKK